MACSHCVGESHLPVVLMACMTLGRGLASSINLGNVWRLIELLIETF